MTEEELARLENIALGSLIRKLEDIVRENEGIVRAAEEDRDREVWDEQDEEETGGKVMTHKQNLFKVCFRMSDGQVFEKEFRSFAEATQYVYDLKGLKALFCIGGKTFENVTWINPRQIVSAEVMRVL